MNSRSQSEKSYLIAAFSVFLIQIFLAGLAVGDIPIEELFYPTLNLGHELTINTNSIENCISSPCLKIEYRGDVTNPGTIVWRYPKDNNGESKGNDLTGVRRLTFSAKSSPPMTARFTVGAFPADSARKQEDFPLNSDWRSYQIELSNEALSDIRGGFACTLYTNGTVYLDNINYVR